MPKRYLPEDDAWELLTLMFQSRLGFCTSIGRLVGGGWISWRTRDAMMDKVRKVRAGHDVPRGYKWALTDIADHDRNRVEFAAKCVRRVRRAKKGR